MLGNTLSVYEEERRDMKVALRSFKGKFLPNNIVTLHPKSPTSP